MSLAEDLINDAKEYAAGTVSAAIGEMRGAMSALTSLGGAIGGGALPDIPIVPPRPGDPGAPPIYSGDHFSRPSFQADEPTLLEIPPLDMAGDPGVAPSVAGFTMPDRPQGAAGDATLLADVPAIDMTEFETQPIPDLISEIASIPKPNILAIHVRDAPAYREPEFRGVAPNQPPPPPSNLSGQMRAAYTEGSEIMRAAISNQIDAFLDREFPQFRSGMSAIETRLARYLEGGSALTPEIENAMFNRAVDRNNAEYIRESRKNFGLAARAGFSLPVITLTNQQKDIDQARRDNNARAATEILIKQAELEQTNLQFAVQASTMLRQLAMTSALSYYNGLVTINGQAIEYARSIVDAVVKSYGLAIQYSEIQARIYESEARVYEAKVHGALGIIEAYKGYVQGLEAQANVNLAQVQVYRARIDAIRAEADVYKAQVEATAVKAQVARLVVEVFQAKIQAYAAQINARTAEWQGFEAATRGEASAVQASAEQVKAYGVQVQAYETKIRARTSAIEALLKTNEGAVNVYRTQLEAYKALVEGESLAVKAEVDSFAETIHGFIAKANAISSHSQSEIAAYEAGLRAVLAQAHIYLEVMREFHNLDIHRAEGIAKVAVAAGGVYAGQAQAALSGMNSLAVQTISE